MMEDSKRYIVISDTHDSLDSLSKLRECYSKEYVLMHLGDIVSPFTLKYLISNFNVGIVLLGNNDGDKLLLKQIYDVKEQPYELVLNGIKLLLLHGFSSKDFTRKIVRALAMSNYFDIILFGHTHEAEIEYVGNTLILNPGALSGYLSERRTYGVIDFKEAKAMILDLDTCRVIYEKYLRS